MKESLCLKFFQPLIWQALKWSWIHKSMVAIFQIFFPSWSCCFLPGVVLLKLCWTGIGQIEWPLVVTGSHSGNVLPFQGAQACQPPHFLISNTPSRTLFSNTLTFFLNPAIFPFLSNVKCKGIILIMLLASNRANFTPWRLILPLYRSRFAGWHRGTQKGESRELKRGN